MCGITGIMAFNEIGRMHMIHLANATSQLKHRGPDYQNNFVSEWVGLGHRRLSVIDPTPNGHQPMADQSGRYQIVYNGEIYNYQGLRHSLINQGAIFKSDSDTEVLLNLFIQEGEACLQKLNGCFALAIFDLEKNELFLARDRFGINPLLYYIDQDKFVFGSEMRSLLAYNIPRNLDYQSLNLYLELNYVPAPHTMLEGIRKLPPGTFLKVSAPRIAPQTYYNLPQPENATKPPLSYEQQQKELFGLMEQSVVSRMVADVPLGTFLSGGIDSSIVTALASRHDPDLNTFSIGYRDQPYFDETEYARMVADKLGTRHTVFELSTLDLHQSLFDVWEHLDEPFADSSALPVYVLSKLTRQSVKVALSGDGADELFGGYHKHLALKRSLEGRLSNSLIKSLAGVTGYLPKSRNNTLTNKFRQLHRLAQGLKLSDSERYWYWAGIASRAEALELLNSGITHDMSQAEVERRRQIFLKNLGTTPDLNDMLYTDLRLVLPNDMLTKVDMMSMAHGLEVRVPFLDHKLVEFASKLPLSSKIQGKMRKRLLQDTFRSTLPDALYNRRKQGFEVPLLGWMRKELDGVIRNELLSKERIQDQGIFDMDAVGALINRLHSRDPGDSPARIWGLMVFQKWYNKYLE